MGRTRRLKSASRQTIFTLMSSVSSAQQAYAASDVLYLHALKEKLDAMLAREERTALAQACFDFLPTRVRLDLDGWPETDIFSHE